RMAESSPPDRLPPGVDAPTSPASVLTRIPYITAKDANVDIRMGCPAASPTPRTPARCYPTLPAGERSTDRRSRLAQHMCDVPVRRPLHRPEPVLRHMPVECIMDAFERVGRDQFHHPPH